MPKVKLDSLQPGMVVLSDVKNMDDMLLIPSGCTLSEKHINILHAWGISEVNVEAGGEVDELADPLMKHSADQVKRWETEIKKRFWNFDDKNPVYQEVLKQLLHRRARQLGR